MTVKVMTEHHLECLSLTGGCTDSSESTLVKMPHCWKSHFAAHMDECRRKGKMLLFLYVLSQCVIKQADKCNKLSQLTDNFMSGHTKVTIQCYCFVSELYVCYSHVT